MARASNAAEIRLYVDRDNLKAQRTYAQLGMSMTNYLVMEEKPCRQTMRTELTGLPTTSAIADCACHQRDDR
jgi:hypothetical protein